MAAQRTKPPEPPLNPAAVATPSCEPVRAAGELAALAAKTAKTKHSPCRPPLGGGGTTFLFNTKIQNSTAAAVEFRILSFAKYQYLPNTKIQKSTATALEF